MSVYQLLIKAVSSAVFFFFKNYICIWPQHWYDVKNHNKDVKTVSLMLRFYDATLSN